MKRHTRSSRHSQEDASRGSGERSTRSRKSSDDLFVTELPKPARSRKPSVEEPDSRKDAAKRRHPSGSKHRTRSHSGSGNHLQEVSPAKVPRRESGSRGSTSKATDKNSPEGDGRVEIPKRHDTRNKRSPQELAQTSENKKHAAKVGNSHSTRTRNDSGKQNSREDHGQTGTMFPNKVTSVAKKPPAVDSLSQPSEASIPHSVKRSSDATKTKISHKPPALTNSQGGKGVFDSYKISHNPQKALVQGIKRVVDKDKTAMPAGVEENASKSNTNQIRTVSSEAKKTSPDTSLQTELRVNHAEVSSHIPEEIVGEGLIDGTQNRRRNKSSSRNLAPEFNSSVKKQPDERPKVVTNSGNDSTTGDVARMKELSSGPKTCPDAIMPMELSGEKGGDSKVSNDRSASGVSNSDSSRADVITVPTSRNTDQMPPSVQPSSAKNSLLNKPKQSPMSNKDKESLSGIHEETHSSSKSTSNTPKDNNLQILDTHQKVMAKAQSGLEVSASAKSSSISKSSDLASTSAPPISAGGDNNDSGGRVTPLNKEVDPTAGGDVEQDVGFEASDWSRDVAESEPFFFESDHLALKGNKDYRMLLRTLTTLEAQRKQATQDLERLVKEQKQALSEPINFVNKIQHKVDLQLPLPQRVVSLPEVTWETYLGKPENSELLQTMASQKVKTRPSNSVSGSSHHNCLCCKKNGPCSKSEQHSASSSGTSSAKTKPTSTDPKSETFNQAWTSDEQRRLEELLVKYPMEAVEARRWEKIAKALGHRTPLQVASRVQKYFIKLTRAGLSVPGRLPHTTQLIGKRGRGGRFGFMRPHIPSTFLQSWVPPVFMNDNDSWDSFDSYQDDEELSDDDTIPTELRDSEEYKELKKLRQLKNEKIRQQAQMTHLGFQCDRCGVEPIVGTRWHCSDCPSSTSTDLCHKCMDKDDYQSIMHTSSHHLEPIRFKMEATYVDGDYVRFQQQLGSYNYLDTNYAPLHKPEYNS